jgi:tetratricopeptide (TPR) repeat protein
MENKTGPFNGISAVHLAAGIRLGLLHYSQGRLEDAMAIFRGLAFLDPRNPYLHALLGSVLQKQGRDEQAITEYSEALKYFPEDISSLANRGELYFKAGNIKEAMADLKRAAELDPEEDHPSANRARLLLSMAQSAVELVNQKGIDALKELRKESAPKSTK